MSKGKKEKLTDKQSRFCDEYMIDLNATQVAIRAGYSENTAKEIACENLTKPNIQERIHELQKEAQERNKISAVWVSSTRNKEDNDWCNNI